MDDLRIGRRFGVGILTLGLAVVLVACGSATGPDTTVTSPPDDGLVDPSPDPAGEFVVPRPGQLDVHDVAADQFSATVDGSTLTVTASWTSGVEPCSVLDTIVVDRSAAGVFTITLREGHGPEEIACIAIAETHVTEFEIPDVAAGTYTLKDSQGLAPDVQVTVG